MKLIQLNIWAGRLTSPVENFFKSQSPDIVCMQEVIDVPGGRAELFTALEELQDYLKMSQAFFSPTFGFGYDRRHARLGNLIAAREKFLSTHSFFTHEKYIHNIDLVNQDTNMRNLQHAIIKLPGGDLNILNHHGYWVGEHKNGNEATLKACRAIASYISKLNGKVILCGDFNLAPQSQSIKEFDKILINLSVTNKLTTTRTTLTHKKDVCDYIFVSKDIKVKSFRASDAIVSDHMALILDFDV